MARILFITFLFISSLTKAQDNAEFAEFVEGTLSNLEVIPGVSVAVVRGDQVIYTGGFGMADVENQIPATSETNFYIASTTKAFTGLMTTMLAEKEALDLSKSITSYRPFAEFEKKDLFEEVTIQDLLSHTSGVDNPYLSWRLAYSGEYTYDEILYLVENYSESLENQKQFDYTNYGYYLISLIIKEEFGKDWRVMMDEMIFTPLGMEGTTGFVSEDPDHAKPYDALQKEALTARPFKTDATMHAAGGLLLNAEDAATFLQEFLKDGNVNGNQIVSEKVIQRATAPMAEQNDEKERLFTRETYANGWNIGTYRGEEVLYHFGGYTGFSSHFSFMPGRDLGVAVFVNHDVGFPVAELIASYAYEFYSGNEKTIKELQKEADKDLPTMLDKIKKQNQKHLDKLAARQWDLKLPRSSYEGDFHNETMGTVHIEQTENSFRLSSGNMSTIATAYPEPNCLRVELIPGRGTIIQFLPEDGKADKLNWNGEVLERIEAKMVE